MRPREFVLLLLCIFVFGGLAGLMGPVLGVPLGVSKVVAGVLIAAAFLYLDRHEPRPLAPRRAPPYVSPYMVRIDDTEVVVTHDGKFVERVAWADLITVGVRIDDDPVLPEPWWLLFGGEKAGVHYPGSARGAREMLGELQRRLPGFDNAGVIQAMGLMSGGVVVWERAPAGSSPS
jgi:hypothetical protein